MSDATGSGDKSSAKSTDSKSKDSGSKDSSASKTTDAGGASGKSAKESIGGAKDVHYGFFSSVRTPEYRSGWDDIWGAKNDKRPPKTNAKRRSRAKSSAGAKSATVGLKIDDLPDDVRDGLVEAARKKMRKSRASYDKLDSSGRVDWTISVKVDAGPK